MDDFGVFILSDRSPPPGNFYAIGVYSGGFVVVDKLTGERLTGVVRDYKKAKMLRRRFELGLKVVKDGAR